MKDGNSTRCCESRSAKADQTLRSYKPLFRLAEWEGKPERDKSEDLPEDYN